MVSLGIPGPRLASDESPWWVSKIGGVPAYMEGASGPAEETLECDVCSAPRLLAAQVYAPLGSGADEERTLQVFACRHGRCQNSRKGWLVWRTQARRAAKGGSKGSDTRTHATPTVEEALAACSLESHDNEEDAAMGFGATDDWSMAAGASATDTSFDAPDMDELEAMLMARDTRTKNKVVQESPLPLPSSSSSASASKAKGKEKKANEKTTAPCKPTTTSTGSSEYFPSYQLDTVDEPDVPERTPLTAHERALLADYERREGSVESLLRGSSSHHSSSSSSTNEEWSGETYEKSDIADRALHKFHKRLMRAPSQAMRYAYDDTPLRATADTRPADARQPPRCVHCGALCRFELQLISTLVPFLNVFDKEAEASGDLRAVVLDGVDGAANWNTVVVYSCELSCRVPDAQGGLTECVAEVH